MASPIPARTTWQLARAADHLRTALRLRRETAAPQAGDPGARRTGLAFRGAERSRDGLRHGAPGEAEAIWQALYDGRWSVVDRIDSAGRHALLVRRNEPGRRDPRAITAGERDVLAGAARGQSNKYIGFRLGIAPSSVSSRLDSALRKLGLASRREAIGMLAHPVPRT
jgi:DNA-binding CsgD family transcriptional regulator